MRKKDKTGKRNDRKKDGNRTPHKRKKKHNRQPATIHTCTKQHSRYHYPTNIERSRNNIGFRMTLRQESRSIPAYGLL